MKDNESWRTEYNSDWSMEDDSSWRGQTANPLRKKLQAKPDASQSVRKKSPRAPQSLEDRPDEIAQANSHETEERHSEWDYDGWVG